MRTFTGRLKGGPDNGNYVTSTTEKIHARARIELWLDGTSPDKAINMVIVTGCYLWNEEDQLFKWMAETADFYTRKAGLT